jgi:hypothetical protein
MERMRASEYPQLGRLIRRVTRYGEESIMVIRIVEKRYDSVIGTDNASFY